MTLYLTQISLTQLDYTFSHSFFRVALQNFPKLRDQEETSVFVTAYM